MRKHVALALLVMVCISVSSADEADAKKTVRIAKDLVDARNYDAAVLVLKNAIKKNNQPQLRLELGKTYAAANKKQEAVETLEKLITDLESLPPGEITFREKLLKTKADRELLKLCPHLKELRELKEEALRKWVSLGEKARLAKDYPTAQKAVIMVLSVEPENEDALKLQEKLDTGGSIYRQWKNLTSLKYAQKKHLVNKAGSWFAINEIPKLNEQEYLTLMQNSKIFKNAEHWIFYHPVEHGKAASVTYKFQRPIRFFKAQIAIANTSDKEGKAVFKILADGKEVFKSKPVKSGEPPTEVKIRLGVCRKLELIADPGTKFSWDFCTWINPMVR